MSLGTGALGIPQGIGMHMGIGALAPLGFEVWQVVALSMGVEIGQALALVVEVGQVY